MKQEEINKLYKDFLISKENIPDYNDDPYDFAKGFKKFTLLRDVDIAYSDTSKVIINSNNDK